MTNLLLFVVLAWLAPQPARTPQAAVDELLAADRGFSAAGAKLDVIASISAMFADDVVIMPVPPDGFARGKAKAIEALSGNPDNPKSMIEWTPIRGGISADGQHGFTFGYMTLRRPDASRVPIKYLSYWVRQQTGWRVAVYKRGRSAEVSGPHDLMPPALPAQLVAPTTDAAVITRYRDSLDRAERAFSDEAQKIGIGPAFAKHGSPDAVNMGPAIAPRFIVGAEAIGRGIAGAGPPAGSPLTWAPDQVIVASSGDLGVTVGMLRRNAPPPEGQPATIPFITVWRRGSVSQPWRYVAE
jgi:ketosteroid isomerase-like protein